MAEDDDCMNASYEEDDPEAEKSLNLSLNVAHLDDSLASEGDSLVTEASVSFTSDTSVLFSEDEDEQLSTSTPKKGKPKGGATKKTHQKKSKVSAPSNDCFKKPAPPGKGVIGACPECRRGFKTLDGLNNHILTHEWKSMATKKPSSEEVLLHCIEGSRKVLEDMASSPYGGEFGEQFNNYVTMILGKEKSVEWAQVESSTSQIIVKAMAHSTTSKGAAFASALRGHLYESVGKAFSQACTRDELIECLMRVAVVCVEVAYPFLLEYMRKLANSALTFVFMNISGSQGQNKRRSYSTDNFASLKGLKLIHYISGACMRAHIRHANRYPHNERLKLIRKVILNKFTTFAPSVAQPKDKSYWTAIVNRKALLFVNDNAFPFFQELAMVLQKMEMANGSIGHEAVMEKVAATPSLLNKWDNVIGGSLDEDVSFNFMCKVLKTITNTYGCGILLRRTNKMQRRGKGSKKSIGISHRARLI